MKYKNRIQLRSPFNRLDSLFIDSLFINSLFIILLSVFLFACGGSSAVVKTDTSAEKSMASNDQSSSDSSVGDSNATEDSSPGLVTMASNDAVPVEEEDLDSVPETVAPPRIVESCKKEPYVKYEKRARNSIKIGWEATKAERFGVGFRHSKEYKRWSNTHNKLFKKVSGACKALSACAKKHKKNKQRKCASQAKEFKAWQATAKRFSKNVKSAERNQPPRLCSMDPQDTDASHCFEKLAENIDDTCRSEECFAVSQCWRSISFLDGAIRQAEQACKFVHTQVSKCRGFTEATGRRKARFAQCAGGLKELNIKVQPVL